jgi:hypothetical protein
MFSKEKIFKITNIEQVIVIQLSSNFQSSYHFIIYQIFNQMSGKISFNLFGSCLSQKDGKWGKN